MKDAGKTRLSKAQVPESSTTPTTPKDNLRRAQRAWEPDQARRVRPQFVHLEVLTVREGEASDLHVDAAEGLELEEEVLSIC